MARKRRHTRHITEIIESSDVVYRGTWTVVFQSRVAPTLYILTKEDHPRLIAHTMPGGLIFWHKATKDTREGLNLPYHQSQDDVLFWQNCDQARITDWLSRIHLTGKEAIDGIASEIYHNVISVRSQGAHKAKN